MSTAVNNLASLDARFQNARIRVDEETQQVSAIDVAMLVTGKDAKHSSKCIERLPSELSTKCRRLKINGKGRLTCVCDAPTAVELIWELPGKAAKAFRRQSAQYICRILGADRTLIDEIELRFERTSEESKKFFTANVERPHLPERSDEERDRILKRKRDDLEILEREAALRDRNLHFNQNIIEMFNMDAEIIAAANDNIKKLVVGEIGPSGLLKNDLLPDISAIVWDISKKTLPTKTLSKIGRNVSTRFQEKYGHKTPDKVMRFCNGKNVMVNAYREKDRDLVTSAVKSFVDNSSE